MGRTNHAPTTAAEMIMPSCSGALTTVHDNTTQTQTHMY